VDVTVITATIPPRSGMLARSVGSVANQTLKPKAHLIEVDLHRTGAAATRDRLLRRVDTEWVAVLDDDDELLPDHLETLTSGSDGADLVYSHFRYSSLGNGGHLEQFLGRSWDNAAPHQITVTWLARTQTLLDVGGFSEGFDPLSDNRDSQGNRIAEDYWIVLKLAHADARIVHVPKVTWIYHVGHPATQGRPDAW
jgi:hypothetical protein